MRTAVSRLDIIARSPNLGELVSPVETAWEHVVGIRQRCRAGFVYVTPDALPSPYDTLPTGRYWSTELGKLRG